MINPDTGEKIKNIQIVSRGNRIIYRVIIERHGRTFNRDTDSLERALEVKQLALDFHSKNGRVPKDYKELGLSKYDRMTGISIDKSELPIECECRRCHDLVTYCSITPYYEYVRADRICTKCRNDLAYQQKFSESDTDYIDSCKVQDHYYRISMHRRGKTFTGYSKSLEEAIEIRNKVLAFYYENFRLPRPEELLEMGINVRKSAIDPSMKNIYHSKKDQSYLVYRYKNGKHFTKSFRSLEAAKDFRNRLFEFVDSQDRLPTKSEVEDLMSKVKI